METQGPHHPLGHIPALDDLHLGDHVLALATAGQFVNFFNAHQVGVVGLELQRGGGAIDGFLSVDPEAREHRCTERQARHAPFKSPDRAQQPRQVYKVIAAVVERDRIQRIDLLGGIHAY